ncbi:MAG: hypothetical protein HYR84_08285 [Planctomycetes bacterium]|nr:hypothetical protein [Planctomycetota bacterium]
MNRSFLSGLLLAVALAGSSVRSTEAIDPERGVRLEVRVRCDGIGIVHGREGEWTGTKGQSRSISGIQVKIDEPIAGLGIKYRLHVGFVGDTGWYDGAAGFVECHNGIQGIAIELTGPAADQFDVFYQAHVAYQGDTDIFSNGDFCGTRGLSRDIQSLVVVIKKRAR